MLSGPMLNSRMLDRMAVEILKSIALRFRDMLSGVNHTVLRDIVMRPFSQGTARTPAKELHVLPIL
jgi:hypothetical protein